MKHVALTAVFFVALAVYTVAIMHRTMQTRDYLCLDGKNCVQKVRVFDGGVFVEEKGFASVIAATNQKIVSVLVGNHELLYIGHRPDGRAELCLNGEPCVDSFADGGTEILQRWLVGQFRYACP